jgi:hypothetical protein
VSSIFLRFDLPPRAENGLAHLRQNPASTGRSSGERVYIPLPNSFGGVHAPVELLQPSLSGKFVILLHYELLLGDTEHIGEIRQAGCEYRILLTTVFIDRFYHIDFVWHGEPPWELTIIAESDQDCPQRLINSFDIGKDQFRHPKKSVREE